MASTLVFIASNISCSLLLGQARPKEAKYSEWTTTAGQNVLKMYHCAFHEA